MEDLIKIQLFGCPDCGSEMTKDEVQESGGKCKFCNFGDDPNEKLEDLGYFGKDELYRDNMYREE